MRPPRPLRALVPLALVLLCAPAAHGDEPRPFGHGIEGGVEVTAIDSARKESATNPPPLEVGFGIGARWTMRWRLLRAGVDGDIAFHVFAPSIAHGGVVLGLDWRARPGLQLELLADVGLSYHFNVGYELLVKTVTGESDALLPYAGARAGVAWRFGPERHGVLGVSLGFREDLMRRTIHPVVSNCLFGCATTRETWHIGGESIYLLTRIGWEM